MRHIIDTGGESGVPAKARRRPAYLRLAAAGTASAAVALSGGTASPLAPLAFGITAACGATAGVVAGLIAGVIGVAGTVPALARELGAGAAAVNHAAAWLLLFPLAGVASGLAARPWRKQEAPADRGRIARDLHDGVAQTLAHLRLELDLLAHHEVAAASDPQDLARLSRLAERTLADVRAMIRDLTAPMPAGGLLDALRDHVRDVRSPRGPRIELILPSAIAAPASVQAELFRIAQEAISNATRHSGGSTVTVRLIAGDGLRLTVEDDGAGWQPHAARHGVGVGAMRERARGIGASLRIGPRAGGGTVVDVHYRPAWTRSA